MHWNAQAMRCPLLLLLFSMGACDGPGGESVPDPDAANSQCTVEPSGTAPRPLWTEQPDRLNPFTTTGHTSSSLGQIVTCDPNKLGQYPTPEGGNPHPKGGDLQNISTNFHILQSLVMSASLGSKVLAKLDSFTTDVNAPDGLIGTCLCHDVAAQCISTSGLSREACDSFCTTGSLGIPGACSGGTRLWLPNDVFSSATGAAKFGAKQLKLLDELQDFLNSPVFTSISGVLGSMSAAIENAAEISARLQCWIDLFSEGYHLGGFDQQRPDLHMCVGYYGHGAFAGIGEPGKFEIGGRYASHNLSASHRAQMRMGGWGLTAFGKTLTILPNIEFNTQLDDYRFFDKCKPLGFAIGGDPSFSCTNGFGMWVGSGAAPAGTIDVDKIDMFHLVDRSQLQSLDSDGNDLISGGEFVVAGYQPFRYPDHAIGPHQWPRAAIESSWEGQVASVVSTGLNIDPHITPIAKILGTYILYPGVTFIPILTLKAGLEWDHEAYKLRSRLMTALNKNLAPSLAFTHADFERSMHPMQAPDLSAETGVGAYVTPGIKAQLTVGIVVSKYLEVGISGFQGLELDIRPAAHGGLVDLGLALTDALNTSNPPEGPCSPVLSAKTSVLCSDRSYDTLVPQHSDPKSSYACTPSTDASSCCLKFAIGSAAGPPQKYAVCIDTWTGITSALCTCEQGVQACYDKIKGFVPSAARAKIEGWLQSGALASLVPSWTASKSCQQCEKDKSCVTEWWGRTPSMTSLSECALHGYCVAPGSSAATTYDITEKSCLATKGTFYRYQCVDEMTHEITGWKGPGCHPFTSGFPSACGCGKDADCASGEGCDTSTGKCSASPADCACNPSGNADPVIPCGTGRLCQKGACALACSGNSACQVGFSCKAGACASATDIPYAEQIAWLADHPAPGPRHAIESYGLTDMTLTLILSAGVRIGATISLFKKKFEYMIWRWSQAWDLGSTQKATYQPGLEARYLDECNGSMGSVVNHQPGSGNAMTCSGATSYVCRYPASSSPQWANYDQPNELISHCKEEMPIHVEDPPVPTPAEFGDAVSNTIAFGIDAGTTAWSDNQLCVGKQRFSDWAKNPPQLQGPCSYTGQRSGAPASFPCSAVETFTLQIWGCLNTTTPQGAALKNFIATHGLNTVTPPYLVTPTYPSALTSAEVIDLHALVIDPSEPAVTAQFAGPIWAAASNGGFADTMMLRNVLYAVEQCYEGNFQSETVCACNSAADCNVAAGETCSNNQCQESGGTLAVCPFIEFGAAVHPQPCCGDGTVEKTASEECDDGNTITGDGCTENCKRELGSAACCTPGGCVDMDGKSARRCKDLRGNLFFGTSCKALGDCGHPRQGGCLGADGLCNQPITLALCERSRGLFLVGGCKE